LVLLLYSLTLVAGLWSTELTTNVKREATSKRHKVYRVQAMKACRGSGGTSALDVGEWSASRPGRFTPGGNGPPVSIPLPAVSNSSGAPTCCGPFLSSSSEA
jgi:hypothetical protein